MSPESELEDGREGRPGELMVEVSDQDHDDDDDDDDDDDHDDDDDRGGDDDDDGDDHDHGKLPGNSERYAR